MESNASFSKEDKNKKSFYSSSAYTEMMSHNLNQKDDNDNANKEELNNLADVVNFGAVPTPYEYALMSKLAYFDNPEKDPEKEDSKYFQVLTNDKGWTFNDIVTQDGHYAHVWVNDDRQQVVVAHRGSQNIQSWLTDVESVIQLKPGSFVVSAIDLLSHPTVTSCRQKGYRLSTTGHSLGGFLAQVCVFWSQRREYKDTYYPSMSAVVFDSPGVVDFLKTLQSRLESQKDSINLGYLNIHNFCAMPTLVNTYGTQTGTLWCLPNEKKLSFAFVNNHRMDFILEGFDAQTGHPKQLVQMTDWPQANYSQYSSFINIVETLLEKTVIAPFAILNELYKKVIQKTPASTVYDKLFSSGGDVSKFLEESKGNPELLKAAPIKAKIAFAINSHYSPLEEKASQFSIGFQHFDPKVRDFLSDLSEAKELGLDGAALEKKLPKLFNHANSKLLHQFVLEKDNYGRNIQKVVLTPEYKGNVFDFQKDLLAFFKNNGGVPSIRVIFADKVKEHEERLDKLEGQQNPIYHHISRELIVEGTVTGQVGSKIANIKNLPQNTQIIDKMINYVETMADKGIRSTTKIEKGASVGSVSDEIGNFDFSDKAAEPSHTAALNQVGVFSPKPLKDDLNNNNQPLNSDIDAPQQKKTLK